MSSDSDSDICDFTSDAKQLSKNLNKFWQTYKRKEVVMEEPANTISSNEEKKKDDEPANTINSNEEKKNDEEPIIADVEIVQAEKISVQNRVISKLNELSEEIETILKRKGTKKRKKKAQLAQPRRGRSKRQYLNVLNKATCFVLSSDDETQSVKSQVTNDDKAKSVAEINPIVTVRVLWKSVETNLFKVSKYQSLSCIPKYYCEKCNVHPNLLFFTLLDKQINLNESSYVSLRLDDQKVIEGGILPESYMTAQEESLCRSNAQSSEIQADLWFKIQYTDRKINEFNVGCKKDDKLDIIFEQVANYLKEPVENIRLYFDGDIIHPNSRVIELDLEDGDRFDLQIVGANVCV